MEPPFPDKRFLDYVRPLLARKWMVLIAVAVAAGGTYAFYARKPNVYTASTLVYVLNQGDPVTGAQNTQATDRQVEDQATLLDARSTAALVAAKLGKGQTPASVLRSVAITSQPGEDFVQITAHAGTARGAAAIANGFGNEFVSLVNGANTQRIAKALQLSQAQLATLGTNFTSDLTRSDLIAQIQRLELATKDPQVISKMVQTALPPSGPSSPKPVRNALFALALSLFAAIAAAYGFERFDRRLKNPEDMERAVGRSLLGLIPHAKDPSPVRGGEVTLSPAFREPFRLLQMNIELETLDRPPELIVVTSAMPGEGKSTVVRNLALAFREAGRRVAVVDLDLRHPAMAQMFGLAPGRGVTEVLRHEVELEQALQPISASLQPFELFISDSHAGDASANGSNGKAKHPELSVLRTGSRPANPAAVLASERLVEVLDELCKRFDAVLVDSAPLLAVTDTMPLLREADAVLLVGRLNVITRDTAKRLLELVTRVPDTNTKLVGVIANDLRRRDAPGYAYGYGYGPYGGEVELLPESPQPAGLTSQ